MKFKKIFIDNDKWNEVVWFLTEKKITWDNEGHFSFDPRTAIVSFIVGTIVCSIIISFL